MKHLAFLTLALAACGSVGAAAPDAAGGDDDTPAVDAANAPDAAPPCTGTLFVATWHAPGVEIFDCFDQAAAGGTGGNRHIAGASTGLTTSWYQGVAVDAAHDTLYVADRGTGTVRVWANASTVDGDVAPDRVISGFGPTPAGLAYDAAHDRLYITNDYDCSMRGIENASTANGAVTPFVTFTTSACYFFVVDDTHDRLYRQGGGGVAVLDELSSYSGTVGDTYDRVLQWADGASGLALDREHDVLYVSKRYVGGRIDVYANASTGNGNQTAVRTINGDGSASQLDNSMQVVSSGDQLFALNDSSPGVIVYDPASTADGTPTPSRVIRFASQGDAIAYVP